MKLKHSRPINRIALLDYPVAYSEWMPAITTDSLSITFGDWMEGGLLICMSTCSGAYAQIIAMDENAKKPPFWAVVGSAENVSWQDSALAYATFYTHFFRGQTIGECVRRRREASGHNDFVNIDGAETHKSWIEWAAKQADDIARGVEAASESRSA